MTPSDDPTDDPAGCEMIDPWVDPWVLYKDGIRAWQLGLVRGLGIEMTALLRRGFPTTAREALLLAGYRARSASSVPASLHEEYGIAWAGDYRVIAPRGWPHAGDRYAPVILVRADDPRVPMWARASATGEE